MTVSRFQPWLLELLACPICAGALITDPRAVLRCAGDCHALYPVLAGIPVLVPGPDRWMASYREPVLAALAEHDLINPDLVELIDVFATAAGSAEPRRWNDDWVPAEQSDEDPVAQWPAVPDPLASTFGAFVDRAAELDPTRLIPQLVGQRVDAAVELGCGAGALAAALAPSVDRLLVADNSLRAVLSAVARAEAAAGAGEVAAAVLDADELVFGEQTLELVVAANLIDLLEHPDAMIAAAAAGLAPGGRLIVTSPDPSLGDPEGADQLDEAIRRAGLDVERSDDWVPWLRPHREREWQVYFNRVTVARRLGEAPE